MLGIELKRPSSHLPAIGLEQGILFSVQSDKVIRLLPPLIISDAEADEIVARIGAIVREDAARAA
jgi:acetylornithine aminotransferase